jgi:APA family basic amino acid/polyamine antiporter
MSVPDLADTPQPSRARQALPRAIGFYASTAIVVGTIIGSGIFLVPHNVALQVGSVRALFLVWVVGGILSLAGALSLAELGTALPEAGGVYVYLREAYGKAFAFLFGWALLLVINSGTVATLAAAFGLYSSSFLPLTVSEQKLAGAVVIAMFTVVNVLGVRKGAAAQVIFTIAKLAGLATIMGFAFFSPRVTPLAASDALPTPHTTAASWGVALIGVLWAYEGWHLLSFNAGEVKNPSRVLPRSYLLGTSLVMAVYLLANLAYLRVLPLPALAQFPLVAAKAMEVLVGSCGASFVSALILCSIVGSLNGNVLAGPRVYFAMARDGVFFPAAGRVHPRFETPALAIWIQGLWSIVLVASGTFEQLYTYVISTGWIFYGAAVLAVVILRRRMPTLARPYRVWGYPALPILFSLAALAIVINSLMTKPRESLIGFGIVLAGIPIYFLWKLLTRVPSSGLPPQG